MSQRIAHKIAFGPSALNDLARAFDSAWLELCAWGVEANTEQQIKRIRTGLAQRIMEYATEGEQDVGHLKEFGLQGFLTLCSWSSAAKSSQGCLFVTRRALLRHRGIITSDTGSGSPLTPSCADSV